MALVKASVSRGTHYQTGLRLTAGISLNWKRKKCVVWYRNTLWSAQLDKEVLAHDVSLRPFPSLLLLAAIHNNGGLE